MRERDESEIKSFTLFKAIYRMFKCQIIIGFFINFAEISCKLIFSIILGFLFQAVLNLEEEATQAYLLAFFGGIIFFIGQMCRHNNFNKSAFLVGKVRSSLVYLMFSKLSNLSQYTVNS